MKVKRAGMESRIKKARARFKRLTIDAFLVTNPAKVRYLTGFTGDAGICLITQEDSYFISDSRFVEQAKHEVEGSKVIIENNSPWNIIAEKKLLARAERVGLEDDVEIEYFWNLSQKFPKTEFVSAGKLVDELAAIKDKKEIQKIERSLRITEEIFEKYILPQVRPGITENDLASEISRWGKKYGAEKDAFDIEVASGARSSLPHATASSGKLDMGDMVQFDFGYIVDGYPSDFSRVVFLGEPTKKQKEIYQIVLSAQETAIRAAKPGIRGKDLHKIAADYIKKRGYKLPHGTGHGLGIMIHSLPRINSSGQERLRPGHVITIEPGIYVPGWGGIRIEDVIVITRNGCKNLTKFSKDFLIINRRK
jgi:Xaa-Pro aminopeptidase